MYVCVCVRVRGAACFFPYLSSLRPRCRHFSLESPLTYLPKAASPCCCCCCVSLLAALFFHLFGFRTCVCVRACRRASVALSFCSFLSFPPPPSSRVKPQVNTLPVLHAASPAVRMCGQPRLSPWAPHLSKSHIRPTTTATTARQRRGSQHRTCRKKEQQQEVMG